MFEGISKKINLLMAKEGISGMQLARNLGIPASTIKKIRSQEITNPTVATLAPIARYFSVTLEYLLEATNDSSNLGPKQYLDARLISWDEAMQFRRQDPTKIGPHDDNATVFVLMIEASDEGIFPMGSFIIVDSTVIPKHGDFVIAAKKEYPKALLKQFLCAEGGNYLRSFNSITSLMPEYFLLGVVMEYHKQLESCKTAESLVMERNQCYQHR